MLYKQHAHTYIDTYTHLLTYCRAEKPQLAQRVPCAYKVKRSAEVMRVKDETACVCDCVCVYASVSVLECVCTCAIAD